MTFENEINAGVALLNEKRPGWHELVNIETLIMVSRQQCVLGQVFGYYNDGLEALDFELDNFFEVSAGAVEHGFAISMADMYNRSGPRTFHALTMEWRDKLEELQAA